VELPTILPIFNISVSNSGIAKDANLPGCEVLSTGK